VKTFRLVYDHEAQQFVPSAKASKRLQGQFIPTIPLAWFKAAAQLPGKALAVASIIRFEAAKRRSQQIRFTRQMTDTYGIPTTTRRRALLSQEKAGLIRIEQQFAKSPTITVIDTD
jgi:hypothetical protein